MFGGKSCILFPPWMSCLGSTWPGLVSLNEAHSRITSGLGFLMHDFACMRAKLEAFTSWQRPPHYRSVNAPVLVQSSLGSFGSFWPFRDLRRKVMPPWHHFPNLGQLTKRLWALRYLIWECHAMIQPRCIPQWALPTLHIQDNFVDWKPASIRCYSLA